MSHYDCKKCGAAYWQECTCSEGQPMTIEEALHRSDVWNKAYGCGKVKPTNDRAAMLTLAAEVRRLREVQARAACIIEQLVDEDECSFDHHGYCQAHSWFYTDERCPDARGKELLRELAEAPNG